MRPWAGVVGVVCVGVLSLMPQVRADAQQERVRRLVRQLGAKEFAEREAAGRELLEIGGPAAAELKKATKGDDPEIRERARALLATLGPLADLAARDRQERIRASLRVCAMTAEYISTDTYQVADGPKVISLLSAAIRANPDALNSHTRKCLEESRKSLDEPGRAAFDASDVGLYLAGQTKTLADKHPASPLAGKLLYAAGKYDDYLRGFPDGFYAPRARYCLIAGKKRYAFGDEPTRIKAPDAEAAAWPGFLKKYPDFEGADDANYRYARALETKGKLADACLRLWLRFPDGDMADQSVERLLFILDARMNAEQLAAMQKTFEQDKRAEAELLFPADHLGPIVAYLQAIKQMRDGNYAAAAGGFRKSVEQTKAVFDRAGEKTGPAGSAPVNLLSPLAGRAAFEAKLCEQCAALGDPKDGDTLYRLASLIYKHNDKNPLGQLRARYNLRSSYRALEDVPEFYQKSCNYWQAARLYQKVLDDYPACESAAKALYMLANCYCHMGEIGRIQYWNRRRGENVKQAVELYGRFAEKHPDHNLAPNARKAVEVLSRRWP